MEGSFVKLGKMTYSFQKNGRELSLGPLDCLPAFSIHCDRLIQKKSDCADFCCLHSGNC